MRAIFEALGAQITWDDATKTVIAHKSDLIVKLTIGQSEAYVGGRVVKLDVPAQIISSRSLVPLRFVSEALGAAVSWDSTSRTASITSPYLPRAGWAFEGLMAYGKVDPTVVTLPDGSYRMYYIGFHDYSQREPGGGCGGINAAVSADALSWQPEVLSGLPSGTSYGGLDVVALSDGAYRMYYSVEVKAPGQTGPGQNEIHSARSDDGLAWTLEPGVRVGNSDPLFHGPRHPKVITLTDGTYKMFFWDDIRVASVTSKDGLTWGNRQWENIFGADNDVVKLPDGSLRLYVNWLDMNPAVGNRRQEMWTYRWQPLPFSVAVSPAMFKSNESVDVTVQVTGIPGEHVTLSVRNYWKGSFSTQPQMPAITFDPPYGDVPFTTTMHYTPSDRFQPPVAAWLIITAGDGKVSTHSFVRLFQDPK